VPRKRIVRRSSRDAAGAPSAAGAGVAGLAAGFVVEVVSRAAPLPLHAVVSTLSSTALVTL
jgi:hypothetical protein